MMGMNAPSTYENKMPVTTINWKKELSNPLILVSDISAMYIGDATQKRPPQNPVISRPTISISTAAGTMMKIQPVFERVKIYLVVKFLVFLPTTNGSDMASIVYLRPIKSTRNPAGKQENAAPMVVMELIH